MGLRSTGRPRRGGHSTRRRSPSTPGELSSLLTLWSGWRTQSEREIYGGGGGSERKTILAPCVGVSALVERKILRPCVLPLPPFPPPGKQILAALWGVIPHGDLIN